MGKRVLAEIEKEADFMRDLTVQAFIERLGYAILDQVGPTPFEFKFYVVNGLDLMLCDSGRVYFRHQGAACFSGE